MLIKLVKVCVTICCILALGIWLAGCNRLDQAANPTPKPTAKSGVLELTTDSNGMVVIPLEELGISHRADFTLNPSGFVYGKIVLATDSTLAYQATSADNWQVDTGSIRVCQGGACERRSLSVLNSRYDTIPVVAPCTFLGNVRVAQVVGLGQINLLNLSGLVPGARIDMVWGMFHSSAINSDSLGITYYSVGGPAAGYYLGFDQLFYRVQLPNGAGCLTASVRFIIGDSCQMPKAKNDLVSGIGSEITILHSLLYANDLSCDSSLAPVNPILKLRFRDYPLPLRIPTKWGTITDTLINNNTTPAFIYRKTNPLVTSDTLIYYMQNGADDRITVTNFIIRLN